MSFYLCAWFGIVGAFGGGFLVALFGFLRITCTFKFSSYGGGGKEGNGILLSERTNDSKSQPSKQKKRTRYDMGQENICTGSAGGQPPSKRRRKGKLDDEHKCGECTIWLQTGSNEDLLKYHKQESHMRHPFERVFEFINFLSCNGAYKFSSRSDNCLCNACYRDCVRGSGKPRRLSLSNTQALCPLL